MATTTDPTQPPDQTTPLLFYDPHSAAAAAPPLLPPNPNPNPNPNLSSSSPPRKLPIKRRSPLPPSSPSSSPSPGAAGTNPAPPPFKFQRIWSESDEIRFLQGLLGCFSQGLVFPRDLNAFYDRFSESMPQPYSRSQLSEKLRRLRNKHRAVAARVARGLDPSRLAPHDRDVLHLCSRLWDPEHAASSPFAASATPAGVTGNKRRRRSNAPAPSLAPPLLLDAPPPPPPPLPAESFDVEKNLAETTDSQPVAVREENLIDSSAVADGSCVKEGFAAAPRMEWEVARVVLDVFDDCVRDAEARASGCQEGDFATRWRGQRASEFNALSRRLRLFLESTVKR